MKRKKGFTLIELAIVGGIISVISSLAYTSYGKYIRQSRQLEAKTNLATVRQLQISHFQDQRQIEPSLKKIGFLPRGQIRYNIGARFSGTVKHNILVAPDASDSICPCNNDGDINGDDDSPVDPLDPDRDNTADNKKCWAHPRPDRSSLSHAEVQAICSDAAKEKCFGPFETGDIVSQMAAITGDMRMVLRYGQGGNITYGQVKFSYFAIGCTSSSKKYLENANLDIWYIDDKGLMTNIQSGI